jgi:CheY-like chemotaxis protein/REP element-mobilizing transposase RayT
VAVPVLIITPTKGFGELIQQSLEEAGGYIPSLAVNGPEAVERQKSASPAICVLDVDFPDAPIDQFVNALRSANPEIKFVIIPSEKGKDEDILASLEADAYLGKPFYLPDLLENLERIIQQGGLPNVERAPAIKLPRSARKVKSGKRAEIPPPPEWLNDVSLAAQHLTSLSLESASQAALITHGEEIWAYAGELPQPAVQELAKSIAIYWDDGGSDLARFIRLEETGGEHMMYATSLGGDFVLALVFDASTPFSKIRSQAGQLARSLAVPPGEEITTAPQEEIATAPQEDITSTFEEEQEKPAPRAQPLLEDVPPSVPEDWQPAETRSEARDGYMEEMDSGGANLPTPERYTEVALEEESGEFLELEPVYEQEDIIDYQADTVPSRPEPADNYASDSALGKPISMGDEIQVQAVSPALYNLTYACVLIPRFPEHHLTGILASHLSDWVTQVCLAFGWRLEHLSVRPDYLQWIVNLPPTASPGHLMRIVRQHTSRRLFLQFARYEEDNPSGDFWAPGYFILSSSQPPPAHLINEFIHQTRHRQGIYTKR